VSRPATLDRRAVVQAALRVARRVGFDALSMRMVADELGLSAMAAYRHIPNRQVLLELVVDELYAPVPVPSPASGRWDERLRELERAAFREATSVPGQPPVLASGPNQRRLADGVMAILADAGFGAEEAAVAFEVVWAYSIGQQRVYQGLTRPNGAGVVPDMMHLSPTLAEVVQTAPGLVPEDYFDRGFEILLDGLRTRLASAAALWA
jgi:TetR/AcrR family transcriptional regulator, tetracycline repressor protein